MSEVLALAARLGSALQASHEAGLLHSHVAPTQVLFDGSNRPALAWVGLYPRLPRPDARGNRHPWTAPELRSGEAPTAASDVYSLAALMWQLLTEQIPEPAGGHASRLIAPAHLGALGTFLTRALAHDPRDRPSLPYLLEHLAKRDSPPRALCHPLRASIAWARPKPATPSTTSVARTGSLPVPAPSNPSTAGRATVGTVQARAHRWPRRLGSVPLVGARPTSLPLPWHRHPVHVRSSSRSSSDCSALWSSRVESLSQTTRRGRAPFHPSNPHRPPPRRSPPCRAQLHHRRPRRPRTRPSRSRPGHSPR